MKINRQGTSAKRGLDPDSDLDLLIVLDDDVPAEPLGWRALWEGRKDYPGSVDLVACRDSVLTERAKAIGSFAHAIHEEGNIVYERD